MPNIFAPPVAAHRAHAAAWGLPSANHKRKKQKLVRAAAQDEAQNDESLEDVKTQSRRNLEYTAVVTPRERQQRRVAGQPLDQEPPQFPFPHAPYHSTKNGNVRHTLFEKEGDSKTSQALEGSQSLHMQHLAALTTIIQRSLLQGDFSRASRALGLLLREDAVSENATVRNRGFMGIAAEVLLRNGCSRDPTSDSDSASLPFTHEGFERAKRLYERLIVRHPYHKTWPNSVNAVDFYLAMFNLWIYVVHAENAALPDRNADIDINAEADRKMRELEQANQIANRLDACMATVPYMDEPELIRLRAMVALWTADLHENCALLVKVFDPQVNNALLEQDHLAPSLEEEVTSGEHEHLREAGLARDKAQELFSKVERPSDDR